jgi:hypothetical protein
MLGFATRHTQQKKDINELDMEEFQNKEIVEFSIP